jgi:hypothetical protein
MEFPEKDSMKLSVGKWIGGNPQCERGQPLRAAVIGLVRKALLTVPAATSFCAQGGHARIERASHLFGCLADADVKKQSDRQNPPAPAQARASNGDRRPSAPPASRANFDRPIDEEASF